jgi:hypothetical protein
MRCLRAEELSACVDGELPRTAFAAAVAHAEHCAACRAALAEARRLSDAFAPLRAAQAPPSLAAAWARAARASAPVPGAAPTAGASGQRPSPAVRWRTKVAAAAVGAVSMWLGAWAVAAVGGANPSAALADAAAAELASAWRGVWPGASPPQGFRLEQLGESRLLDLLVWHVGDRTPRPAADEEPR